MLVKVEDVTVDVALGEAVCGEGEASVVVHYVGAEEEVGARDFGVAGPWGGFEGGVVDEEEVAGTGVVELSRMKS